jgi:hypothetical protein
LFDMHYPYLFRWIIHKLNHSKRSYIRRLNDFDHDLIDVVVWLDMIKFTNTDHFKLIYT